MNPYLIYPPWATKVVCVVQEGDSGTEYHLFSYKTWICTVRASTVIFNKEPYQVSKTSARHLKWFLDTVLSSKAVATLTDNGKKSYTRLMIESQDRDLS